MLIFALLYLSEAFYLSATEMKAFKKSASIELFVDKLTSSQTQIPYSYYYLNYCSPPKVTQESENIGQELVGDTIDNSPYALSMQSRVECAELCKKLDNSNDDIEKFKWMIENNYRASWIVDDLPGGFRQTSKSKNTTYSIYQDGFPIGFIDQGTTYINNHHNIIIQVYSEVNATEWYIVGFLVEPLSIDNSENLGCLEKLFTDTYNAKTNYKSEIYLPEKETGSYFTTAVPELNRQKLQKNITYSYSVSFEKSTSKWASRWEHYFNSLREQEVHWLGLVNSFAMVLLLSGMVGTILRRAIRRDVSHYNDTIDYEDETGWKQVRSDVFRSPIYNSLFSILIGSGVQILAMLTFTFFFTSLGFLSPEHRGGLLTTMIVLYVFMGIFAGYTSARLFKMFGGVAWKRNAFGTAVLVPGLSFGIFFFVNMFLSAEGSSEAVNFSLLVQILLMWLGISMPLVYLGAFIGFSKHPIENPSKVSKIPKPLQVTPGVKKIKFVSILAGSLPFGCMFIELSYVMGSLWQPTLVYYLFGFLFMCFIVLVITSAEVSILMCYILLCREDYRWWWLSFTVAGSSGVYFFAYTIIYWFVKLNILHISSIVLYFGYMFLASVVYALITGTIGFFASYLFIRTIFSMIKLE